jgi:RNA-splicing ligase RtcB
MADGVILGRGKGNPEWNNSAPHGAGRIMSRSQAKKTLMVEDFEAKMKNAGVWTSCVNKETLDEAPMAYKEASSIIDLIKETVEIETFLKPVYNFKAAEKGRK